MNKLIEAKLKNCNVTVGELHHIAEILSRLTEADAKELLELLQMLNLSIKHKC